MHTFISVFLDVTLEAEFLDVWITAMLIKQVQVLSTYIIFKYLLPKTQNSGIMNE